MGQYENLVKALRHCVSDEKGVTKCAGCPYYPDMTGCMDRLHTDAAAAIEALQAEVEELKAKKKKLAENSLRFVGKVRELDKRRLEPKRGEWKETDMGWDGDTAWVCSVCGEPWTLIDGTPKENNMNFCPNCGSRMRGEVNERG